MTLSGDVRTRKRNGVIFRRKNMLSADTADSMYCFWGKVIYWLNSPALTRSIRL